MAAGAFPVLPDRLVYPERIPAGYRERCLYEGEADLTAKVRWALQEREAAATIAADLAAEMARFDWSVVAPQYDAALERLAAGGGPGPGA